MTYLEAARKLDAIDSPAQAAWAYEKSLVANDSELADYMNLAALYFTCMDGGYSAYHHLEPPFIETAEQRFFELLDEAEKKWGSDAEIIFWRHFFPFVHYGGEPFQDLCKTLIERGRSRVPYVYLYAFIDQAKYAREAELLLDDVRSGSTARERYIRSVLQSHALGQS